jgi:hypothetical protein
VANEFRGGNALNDKAFALLPPYDRPEQRAMLDESADFDAREFWIWSRDDTHRYFLAGGGGDDEFDELWALALSGNEEIKKAIAAKTYAYAGGGIGYLVAGRKPFMTSAGDTS